MLETTSAQRLLTPTLSSPCEEREGPAQREGEEYNAGKTKVTPPARLDRAGLIELARQVAVRLGKEHICRGDFVHATGIGDIRIKRHFKGWRDLFEAAGVTPRYCDGRLADETLFKALSAAFLKEGRIATRTPAGKIGAHSVITYCKRWGNWTNTLAAFHAWIARHDPAFPLLGELREALGPALGPSPEPPAEAEGAAPIHWRATDGRQYGEALNLKGLQHAPLNEQGVVLLFGMMAAELGFIVEAVTTGYPDCEAKRRVAVNPERWQRVRIEFEWQSRSFRTHGHDPEGCDLIVCWEHNWPECPVEVLELKREVRRLAG
jgi:hypothetical protein